MDLHINTIKNNSREIEIQLIGDKKVKAEKKIRAQWQQAEKLLSAIEGLLKNKKVDIREIKKIFVVNKGGSFTALRIGVVVANALGYALGVPVADKGLQGVARSYKRLKKVTKGCGKFDVVKPVYYREPNITLPSSK